MPLKIETIVNGPFQENCYLVWDDDSMQGIFIDPGDEPQKLMKAARFNKIEITGIFNTHGHLDHAGAVAAIVEELKVPFAIHPEDAPKAMELFLRADSEDVVGEAVLRIRGPEATWQWMRIVPKVLERNEDGSQRRTVILLMDETERQAMLEEVRTERRRLETALNVRGVGIHDLDLKTKTSWRN